MVVNKTKKVRKLRGSRTHAWGSPKKHRGAGSRGGRGMAGSGKKGQQKMTALHNIKQRIGKSGFIRPLKVITSDVTINLSRIELNLDSYITSGVAEKSGATYNIDLSKAGVQKVLGSGIVSSKINVTAEKFSSTAIEKIEKAGGKAIVLE
ncbi:MAG: 50S ribosomal protein L15 [Nanohaloarchaea archaeon]|nr:50S ribosomal protein L15 [Candidatus Nanohaloarchaea archaeon]